MVKTKLKIAILADAITTKGGSERVILHHAEMFDADIYTVRYSQKTTFDEFKNFNIYPISKKYDVGYGNIFQRFFTLYAWFRYSFFYPQTKYDCFIIHGAAALNAAKKCKPNVWYCHSPSRYLYDLYEEEKNQHKGLFRLFYPLVTYFQRKRDQNNVKYVQNIAANSSWVKDKIKKYYGREAEIIFPCVKKTDFKYINQGNYYLSVGTLIRTRNVDKMIDAFKQIPDKNLVIAGDGPEKNKLQKMAKRAKNIKILGFVSKNKLRELYGKSIATIYITHMSDFGIIPIESMFAGKPVIGIQGHGISETVIHKKTGFLIQEERLTEKLIEAILWLDKKRALSMKKDCISRARFFEFEEHHKKLKKLIGSPKGDRK